MDRRREIGCAKKKLGNKKIEDNSKFFSCSWS
jgi:hypothetical protein